jgi:hypothetical protein
MIAVVRSALKKSFILNASHFLLFSQMLREKSTFLAPESSFVSVILRRGSREGDAAGGTPDHRSV